MTIALGAFEQVSEAQAQQEIVRLNAKATRHDVDWRGRRVAWRQFGDGPPLVLVHGAYGSWLHWSRNIEVLAQRHTIWLPDMPGFGDSDELAGDVHAPDRMQRLLEALAGSLDSLLGHATPIDLAGFSFGGLVASHLAAQRGGVRRMALLGPAGHGTARRQHMAMKNWRVPERDALLAALRNNLLALMLYRPATVDAFAVAIHEHCCTRTRFRSKAISRPASLKATLERYMRPLLLIYGEHDVTGVPEDVCEMLSQGYPRREWCTVPHAGHWAQYECPHDVNQLLLSWFGREYEA